MASALEIVQKFFPAVKTVEDANRKCLIEVTAHDNSSATVKNHKACAMAVACKRKFKLDGVIVSVKTAYLVKGTHARRFQLSERVSREVVSFDRNGGFAQGEYELNPPMPSSRIGKNSGKRGPHKTAGKEHFRHITQGIRSVLGSKDAS